LRSVRVGSCLGLFRMASILSPTTHFHLLSIWSVLIRNCRCHGFVLGWSIALLLTLRLCPSPNNNYKKRDTINNGQNEGNSIEFGDFVANKYLIKCNDSNSTSRLRLFVDQSLAKHMPFCPHRCRCCRYDWLFNKTALTEAQGDGLLQKMWWKIGRVNATINLFRPQFDRFDW
jgi:hypothetical protein